MNTSESMKDTLKLQPIGTDFWSRPVYKDQYGQLWKDVTLGSDQPELCSVVENAFDGEPDMPIRRPFQQGKSRGLIASLEAMIP